MSENEPSTSDCDDVNGSSLESDSSISVEQKSDSSDNEQLKLADDDFRKMPFEELLQLKRRLGSKVYNEAVFGKTNSREAEPSPKLSKKKRAALEKDSDSDGPPEELNAKRKVPMLGMEKRHQKAAQSRSKDPRFDANQGYFSGRKFREQYGFINELRSEELASLQAQLEESVDPIEIDRLKFAIRRTENQVREFNKQKEQDKKRQLERQETRKAIEEGKRPFYEKKSTKKARELVEKYDQLRETGKLGKHIDKRRKKNTAKDRKKLDFST
ncbi:ribosomal RNA processing protein 36 homolog [Topomyia yanbarensis]|uniref:ribosomal RNA processing protein 36 homolog n=1 Tax=Topomyia yanbarensis TaxID=2498891 RepID=UPI00273B368B|nr:ribosomal RNA processing protein 36 homolog [Topomyia yanbarensis]